MRFDEFGVIGKQRVRFVDFGVIGKQRVRAFQNHQNHRKLIHIRRVMATFCPGRRVDFANFCYILVKFVSENVVFVSVTLISLFHRWKDLILSF